MEEAVREVKPDATMIYVPPAFCASAIIDAIQAEVPLVVTITEGIPQQDMVKVSPILYRRSQESWYYTTPPAPGFTR